jgi:hypothetical protein
MRGSAARASPTIFGVSSTSTPGRPPPSPIWTRTTATRHRAADRASGPRPRRLGASAGGGQSLRTGSRSRTVPRRGGEPRTDSAGGRSAHPRSGASAACPGSRDRDKGGRRSRCWRSSTKGVGWWRSSKSGALPCCIRVLLEVVSFENPQPLGGPGPTSWRSERVEAGQLAA